MADTDYLVKRHNVYHVIKEVPRRAQSSLGRRLKRTLGTGDLRTAARLKLGVLAEFDRQIEEALTLHGDPLAFKVRRMAPALRAALKEPEPYIEDPEGHSETTEERVREMAHDLERLGRPELARVLYGTAMGTATHIGDTYPVWLAEAKGTVKASSLAQHVQVLKHFLAEPHAPLLVQDATRLVAGAYVGRLLKAGKTRKTAARYVWSLSTYWRWLVARGHATENPWRGHGLTVRKKAGRRKPLTDETLVKLLTGTMNSKYTPVIHDLLRLELVTGARLDEWCSAPRTALERREDGWWLNIEEGKTDAAARSVPLHKAVWPIVERRLADGDAFFFAGLIPGGHDKKRSWEVSKAFGRYRTQNGVTGAGEVFHALRNTFTAALEGAGVPESTAKLLVGHARESMTYGHYSQGQRVDLRAAVDRITYSPEVMRHLRA